jgi:hypothetical protein
VVSWLCFRRDWRCLVRFALSFGVAAALAFGVVQWTSHGRFLTTFMTFTFAGTGGPVGWIRAPNQLVLFGSRDVAAVWIMAPFAVMAVFASRRMTAPNVYHHALCWSLLLTLVVYTDMGAGSNQLLDLAALSIAAVGSLAARVPLERLEPLSLSTALALALGWAGITGVRGFVPDLREALAMARSGETPQKYNPRPLATVLAPGDTLLAEDPTIPVLLGQTPIVLDAFMLRRLDDVQPDAVDGLVARIERGEFDHVALVTPLEEDDFWWQHYNFGLRIAGALRKTYVFVRMVDGYYLYQPSRS